MGISHDSDIVNFAIKNILEFSYCGEGNVSDDILFLCCPESQCEELGLELDELNNKEIRGWKLQYGDHADWDCGHKKYIWGPLWTKGDHKVWIVNESPYESVGENEMTAVADDKASLEAFMADWKDTFNGMPASYVITETEIVSRYN